MKLTPVSGCDVQASSVVAHFVSISVSARGKKRGREAEGKHPGQTDSNRKTDEINRERDFQLFYNNAIKTCVQKR